jgi:hypothetical protein
MNIQELPTDEQDAAGSYDKGAIFSDCHKYRYVLWRTWDEDRPILTFIGLNPSTANKTEDDNTIKRVRAIAKHSGYGGIIMLNLFAIISSDPAVLKTCADPLGDNDKWLNKYRDGDIVFAWGNFKEAIERAKVVSAMFPTAYALHINKNGSPKHPLFCRIDSRLIPYFNQ